MPLLSVKLVLFDLDGTLVHSARDLAYAANRMLDELGQPPQPVERITGWVGDGMVRLVKRALAGAMDREPPSELFERGLASFERHYAANLTRYTRPFPGVVTTLETLHDRGFVMGCATNKPEAFAQPLLAQLGLAQYLGIVVGGDTVAKRKPNPLPLEWACAQAGIRPARAVMVGDSANDVLAARAAGLRAIAVTYGYSPGRNVRELEPDIVVDSAAEVPQYLRLSTTEQS